MKLYRYFQIKEKVEFVNVKLEKDNRIFIDPYLLKKQETALQRIAYEQVTDYLQKLIECANTGNDKKARKLVRHLVERPETRIGYSRKNINGLSIGKNGGQKLYEVIKEKKEQIEDIFDCAILLEKVGEDKISDMIITILSVELIRYTQEQCEQYRIPTETVELKGKVWNTEKESWIPVVTELPVDEERQPIIFLPKELVSPKMYFNYEKIYQDLYIPYCEQLEKDNEKLIIRYKNGKQRINRKELKKIYPCNKKEIQKYIKKHREEYEKYKESVLKNKM